AITIAALKLMCPAKMAAANSATPFTAEEFCALFKDVCGGANMNGITEGNCVATYTGWATKKVMGMPAVAVQSCTSYHLCNAGGGGQGGNAGGGAAGTGGGGQGGKAGAGAAGTTGAAGTGTPDAGNDAPMSSEAGQD